MGVATNSIVFAAMLIPAIMHVSCMSGAVSTSAPASRESAPRVVINIEDRFSEPNKRWYVEGDLTAPLSQLRAEELPIEADAAARLKAEYAVKSKKVEAFKQQFASGAKERAPELLQELHEHPNWSDLAVSPDGTQAIYLRESSEPAILKAATGEVIQVDVGKVVGGRQAAWSEDGKLAAITVRKKGERSSLHTTREISIVDAESGREVRRFGSKDYTTALLFAPDGNSLLLIDSTRRLKPGLHGLARAIGSHPIFLDTFYLRRVNLKTAEDESVLLVRDVPEIDVKCNLKIVAQ